MKFRSDIYLGLFFVVCGWIFPIVFFYPFSESSAQYYTYWANFLIPINTCLLTYFLDEIVFDKLKFPSFIYTVLSGISLGIYLTNEGVKIQPVESAYGKFYTGVFETTPVQIFLNITYLMILSLNIRFFYLAIKFHRLRKPYVRRFFILIGAGYLFWLVLTILKRIFPYYLYGLDYLIMSLVYLFITIGYLRNRNQLTILPGGLRYLLVEMKDSGKKFLYDFKTSNFILGSEIPPEMDLLIALYDTMKGTERIFRDKLAGEGPISLTDVNFQNLKVSSYNSEHFQWMIFSLKESKLYTKSLSFAINKFERKLKESHDDHQIIEHLKAILIPLY